MDAPRSLVIVADDFGIGPATSRGILRLADQGKLSAAVLLVNSPHAEEAVRDWRRAGGPRCVELGWHACLTLDRPVLPPSRVPSLVRADGRFVSLPRLFARLAAGRVRWDDLYAELGAQYARFVDLAGQPPALVNGHHHVHVLPRIGRVLMDVIARQRPLPYVRRVRETLPLLLGIPRSRFKRGVLATLGLLCAGRQQRGGFPGNDYLVGVSDPRGLVRRRRGKEENLLVRWLTQVPGRVVEYVCHPGYRDDTLPGRDVPSRRHEAALAARVREMELVERTDFGEVCRAAGFRLVSPSGLSAGATGGRLAA